MWSREIVWRNCPTQQGDWISRNIISRVLIMALYCGAIIINCQVFISEKHKLLYVFMK